MAVKEYLIYAGAQLTNELVKEYAEPQIPTVGFPGLLKAVIGGAGLFVSDRFLSGDVKTVGYVVSAGLLARGLVELVKGLMAPAGTKAVVVTPSAPVSVSPAPVFY